MESAGKQRGERREEGTSCTGREEKLIVRGSLFTATDPERDREEDGERERDIVLPLDHRKRVREKAQKKRRREPDQKQRCKGRQTPPLP